jgi:hypothetical protein
MDTSIVDNSNVVITIDDERSPIEKLKDDMFAKDKIVKTIRKSGDGDLEKAWNTYIKAVNKYYEALELADKLRKLKEQEEESETVSSN